MIGRGVEHLAVQAGFGIALTQLAEQQLAHLGHQLRIGRHPPLRVRRQLLAIELPEQRRQTVPQPRRNLVGARFERAHHFDQKGHVGFFRPRQHQVGLELIVGLGRALEAFGTVGGQLDQGSELLLQAGHGRVAQQALVGLDVGGPEQLQEFCVLVQAEALVPGRAVGGAVIQAAEFAGQFVEGEELFVAGG
ncbi:hypothetical protein D3C76_1197600 [compost metagenome]